MKLSELAQQHNLEPGLLREVVEEDLSIKLPKGMDTDLKDDVVARILASDGLETVDNKPFTPIIAKEFEEKHKRKVASKKGAETRKKKLEEEADKKRREDEERLALERKRHEDALAQRQREEAARAAAQAEAERRLAEELAASKLKDEESRVTAEADMLRREEEARRMAAEFAAMRQQEAIDRLPPAPAVVEAPAAEAPLAPAVPAAAVVVPAAAPKAGDQPAEVAPEAPVQPAASAAPADQAAVSKQPAHPTPPAAPAAPIVPAKLSALGSKLASLAKATHEKADHSIKAKPGSIVQAPAATPGIDQSLSPEDRRRLIQANIQRNLEMAKRVQAAKSAVRRKPGFAAIDRTKTPGPNRGPNRPGGPPKPGGAGGPPRGPRRDSKDHRTDAEIEQAEGKAARRFRSTLEEEDVSGVTAFSISLPCTVREFSEGSGIKSSLVIAKLFMAGMMANINSVLDKDSVELLAAEFKKTVTVVEQTDAEEAAEAEHAEAIAEDKDEDLAPRPPVVTIMGHVDHGKTSLLDAIRKTDIAKGEAGGITQHIGAYTVTAPNGQDVTFIDTPGHEAFTDMRARGAQITDVAVIVVDAVDGVMPQTREAINHAKAANVSIVVAMNKIDKPEAGAPGQKDKILRQLAEAGLQAEDWGGEIGVIGTSALTGQGIPELLERLALETAVKELKANHFAKASGVVIEAKRDEGQGVTATLLVRRGSLAIGDIVLAGVGYGRVRLMVDWKGERTDLAGPSQAVEVIGLNELPRAGDKFQVLEDLQAAVQAAEIRQQKLREKELQARSRIPTSATVLGDIAASKRKELRIVIKADTSGSLEVLLKTIHDLATDDVRVSIIHQGVGGITASDISLAEASKALVLGFHVIADGKARRLADDNGVEIRSYTIIYELLDELRLAMAGKLDPETRENLIGHAEVRQTFVITKVGVVAGLYITDGIVRRDAFMRITRDNNILHVGQVGSLRRFKEDVKEVRTGFECGLTVERFQDIKVGDIMEFYTKEKVARSL